MSATSPPVPGRAPAAVAPALLERHRPGLRGYLGSLAAATMPVDAIVQEVIDAAGRQTTFDEDPAVWLFREGRRRVLGSGARGDRVDAGDGGAEEAVVEGEDPRTAVHRVFERLTPKQQEVLRLKFQFGFGLEEFARITGVNEANAMALFHHAMQHVCQALVPAGGPGAVESRDARPTAFAFDELDPAAKKAFVAAAGDGKRLLEQTETLRKAGQLLGSILASGAPVPKRRRRRAGSAWKKLGALGALLLVGGVIAVVGWRLRRTASARPRQALAAVEVEAPSANSEVSRVARPAPVETSAKPVFRPRREPRPGEADWEKKPFGKGQASGDGPAGGALAGGFGAPSGGGGGPGGSVDAASGSAQDGAASAGEPSDADATSSAPDSESRETRDSTPDGVAAGIGAAGMAAGPAGPGLASPAAARRSLPAPEPGVEAPSSAAGSGHEAQAHGSASPRPPSTTPLVQPTVQYRWPRPKARPDGNSVQLVPSAAVKRPDESKEPAVRAAAELVRSPWDPSRCLVRISVRGKSAPLPDRPPANLVFAIDVSESMRGPNRLPLVQEGVSRLAERLRPEDRVTVVTYAAEARTVLPGTPLGERALELRNALRALETAGRTNGSDGLRRALAEARAGFREGAINLVVLCTDGNFNLGETEPAPLAALAGAAAAEGIQLSVFGFGRTDRNDLRLELLASAGHGHSCYVNTRDEAERLLAGQVDRLFAAAATGLELTLAFDPSTVTRATRVDLGGEPLLALHQAELLPGRAASAWYELQLRAPAGDQPVPLAEFDLRYRRPGSGEPVQEHDRLAVREHDIDATDEAFRFDLAVTELARIEHAAAPDRRADLDRLEAWAGRHLPAEEGGYRQELLGRIAQARNDVPAQ